MMEGAEIEEEVRKLASNMQLCLASIAITKDAIAEYQGLFSDKLKELGPDGNEINRKYF